MRSPKILAGLLAASLLTGCAEGDTSGTIGTIGGGAAGALLGSQFGSGSGQLATTALGAVAGALAGRAIAQNLDTKDTAQASKAEQSAVASNQPVTWSNPDTSAKGTVEPQRTYQNASGQTCREYTHTVTIDDKKEIAQGNACRQPDGTWQLVG